jgi:hypothetical protein
MSDIKYVYVYNCSNIKFNGLILPIKNTDSEYLIVLSEEGNHPIFLFKDECYIFSSKEKAEKFACLV